MSDEPKIIVDNQVVEHLTEVAETMTSILDKFVRQNDNQSRDLDYFRGELRFVRDAIRGIAKVLHEGNGDKPLISRVAVLEVELNALTEKVDKIIKDIEEKEAEEKQEKKAQVQMQAIDRRGKYAIWAAVVSGLAGLITSLASIFGG